MKCHNCGAKLPAEAKFCKACGTPRPLLAPRFVEAEVRFRDLYERYQNGAIDAETYAREVQRLYVQDGKGDYWMFSATDGNWSRYDGQQQRWVQDEPTPSTTAAEHPAEPQTPQPTVVSPAINVRTSPVGEFCPACGAENPPGSIFCGSCGATLAKQAQATPSASPVSGMAPETPRSKGVPMPLILLMPIGWGVAWCIGWIFGFLVDPTTPDPQYLAIGAIIGGLLTAFGLRRAAPKISWQNALSAAARVGVGWIVGWITAWAVTGLAKGALQELDYQVLDFVGSGSIGLRIMRWSARWGFAGVVASIIAGPIFGLLLGRLLRRTETIPAQGRTMLLQFLLPICWALGYVAGGLLGAIMPITAGGAVLSGIGAGAAGLLAFRALSGARD